MLSQNLLIAFDQGMWCIFYQLIVGYIVTVLLSNCHPTSFHASANGNFHAKFFVNFDYNYVIINPITILKTVYIEISIFYCIVLLLTGNTPLFTQIEPLKYSIKETWVDKVPVSGEIRTGLMVNKSCQEKLKSSFYVNIPKGSYHFLSVEISSNDGRYNYSSSYDITGLYGLKEFVRLSNLKSKLGNYKCDDLTILSWVTNDLNEQKSHFVLSDWENFDVEKNAYIYLNSENPALINISNASSGQSENIKCTLIENKANVAYNCMCILPLSLLTDTSEIAVVQRVRRSQSRYPMNIKL